MKYAIFFLFFCTKAGAQQMPDYIVYLVKGDVTTHKGTAKPAKVKQHQLIYGAETITVKQGAEVTLSDKNGASFVLNAPKAYTVSALSKRQTKPTDNLTQKYLHLLYHELLDPNHDYNKFKKQNAGGVWGGVSRGGECGNLLFPVHNMKSAELKIPFKWRKTSAANYILTIYDSKAKELASVSTKDSFAMIDLSAHGADKPGKYYWRIQGDASSCEDEMPAPFEVVTKEDEQNEMAVLAQNSAAAANKLWIIEQLEKNNYITLAQQYFLSLISSSQNDASLVKTYAWFLLKHNLEEEAKKAWQNLE